MSTGSLGNLWNIIKHTILEKLKFQKKTRRMSQRIIYEIMTENNPNLGINMDIEVHKLERLHYHFNAKGPPPEKDEQVGRVEGS